MGQPVKQQSRKLAQAMRELVSFYFQGEGFDSTAKPVYSKISDAIDVAGIPDVTGVPGVWISVANRGSHRLSNDLDAAQEEAATAGFRVTALIAPRPGREIAQGYAVMTVSDFAQLARAGSPLP